MICLKFKLNAVFINRYSGVNFFVPEKTTHRPQLGVSHQDSQNLQQNVGTENYLDLSLLICDISKNVSA